MYACMVGEARDYAIKKTSLTEYRVPKTVEEETSIKEKHHTAAIREVKNIWRNSKTEIRSLHSTTIARTNMKEKSSGLKWISQGHFTEIQHYVKLPKESISRRHPNRDS